mgnify:CR=1 FL=1
MKKQLECRIVIIHHRPSKLLYLSDQPHRSVELGMYDPRNMRYEFLGRHGPDELDRAVRDLKASIERAGHRLTFCERSA